jgi:hypothetical protein
VPGQVSDSPRIGPLAARLRLHAPDLLALAVIAAIAVLAWYFRVLRPAHIPFSLMGNSDFFTQIYPMWWRIAEWWRAGVLPLWNPYQYAGQPVLASAIYGVLYPPNVLYSLVNPALAIEGLAVAHLSVAGASMYAFAATIGLGRIASFVAGSTFMLSGFVMAQATWFPPALAAAVWLPLALLALERLFRRAELWAGLLLALSIALPFLAGWPQTWMYTMYVIAVYGAGRFVVAALTPEERPHLLRASVLSVAAGVLALAWMAPQLLPSLELQALGPRRPGGLTPLQMMPQGTVTASRVVDTMLDASPGLSRWGYVGTGSLLLIPLALAAADARQRWRVVCLGLLAVFSVSVAVALDGPVHELYRRIGGAAFRVPARLLYVYTAAASVLVAIGFDALARLAGDREAAASSPRLRWGAFGALCVASAGFALLAMPTRTRVHLGAMFVLSCAALLAPRLRARRLALAVLLAWMVVDLMASVRNAYLHPVHNRRSFDEFRSSFHFIAERQGLDRTYIVAPYDFPALMSKQGSLRRIYSITDYEPLSLSRWERFYRVLEAPKDQRPDSLTFTGTLHADPTRPYFSLLDLLSVRFVLLHAQNRGYDLALAQLAPKWRRAHVAPEGGLVYENLDRLPRSYVSSHAQVVGSEEEALASLTSLVFDARASVIVERADGQPRGAPVPAPIVPARIVRYEPARVEIETDAPAAGWLVLTDTHYPGWEATVDGAYAPIARANYLFRAVWVEAGAHRVEFDYRPKSFRLGAAAAAAGLAAAACAVVWDSRRSARTR